MRQSTTSVLRAATPRRFQAALGVAFGCLAVVVTSCSRSSPSVLDPHGPGAERIVALWWFMFAVSAAVVAFVSALLLFAVLPRRRRATQEPAERRWPGRLLLFGGVVFPVVVLAVLWVATLESMSALSRQGKDADLVVAVVGRQWWWEVRYSSGTTGAASITTANEIHIPVGKTVRIDLSTNDVNHSFWVPQLQGKTDLIAGRGTQMWLHADRPGVYRGQCAEYCGVQHANMAFLVVAQSQAAFDAWLQNEAQPASASEVHAEGEGVFLNQPCFSCHTIRGTAANGTLGPDLTHFGSRMTIGAGTVKNTKANLAGWIADSQSIKPGNFMPPIQLTQRELQALVDYLHSLK